MRALARDAPGLRCELVEAEPEQSLPALALGDVDLVLGRRVAAPAAPAARPASTARTSSSDPVLLVLPADHPAARRHRRAVPLAELAGEAWTTGHREASGWEEMIVRTCRELGGFDPDIRHRTNDSVTSLALVAAGQAVTLLPAARPARAPARASPSASSPTAPSTGRSSRRPAPPTSSGRPIVAVLAAIRAAAADVLADNARGR